jgi:hypothetical protein
MTLCNWCGGTPSRCHAAATDFLENGLGYCARHFAAVLRNRKWLSWYFASKWAA